MSIFTQAILLNHTFLVPISINIFSGCFSNSDPISGQESIKNLFVENLKKYKIRFLPIFFLSMQYIIL